MQPRGRKFFTAKPVTSREMRRIKVVDRYYMTYDDYGPINPDPKVAALTHQIGPKSVITYPSGGQKLPDRAMTVIQQDSADRYRVLEDAPTRFGGHSLVVDPATHRIFVAYFGSIAVYKPITQP